MCAQWDLSTEQKGGLEGSRPTVVESPNRITEPKLLLWLIWVELFVIIDEQILAAAAKVKSTKPFQDAERSCAHLDEPPSKNGQVRRRLGGVGWAGLLSQKLRALAFPQQGFSYGTILLFFFSF